jgi:hypothetical protein
LLIVNVNGPTIARSASMSDAIAIASSEGQTVAGIIVPAAWTSAYITFQLSQGPDDFHDVYDVLGHQLSVFLIAGTRLAFEPKWTRGADFMRIRSGTSAKPVVQNATRTFTTILVS